MNVYILYIICTYVDIFTHIYDKFVENYSSLIKLQVSLKEITM